MSPPLELGEGGERAFVGRCLAWRLEDRPGLAGIGIKPEDEKLRRERAEIDRAADQRLRLAPAFGRVALFRTGSLAVALDCGWRCEHEVDRLLDIAGERFERDDAGLADGGRHTAPRAYPAAVPRHLEARLQTRQIAEPRHPRHAGAHFGTGNEIEMLPGLG